MDTRKKSDQKNIRRGEELNQEKSSHDELGYMTTNKLFLTLRRKFIQLITRGEI